MTTPRAVNDQEFEQTVLEADELVLVDFGPPGVVVAASSHR